MDLMTPIISDIMTPVMISGVVIPWLDTWAKRIDVESDHALIDSDLTDFPALFKISTSAGITSKDLSFIFSEIASDVNKLKIAVTTSDSITECKIENSFWDNIAKEGYLWVKCPAMSSSIAQIFYLYYDASQPDNSANVGITGSATGAEAWDSNFKMVQHMKDATTSTITDSTSNNNDGTKVAANQPIEINGKIHKGQDHDGSNDYTDTTPGASWHTGSYTVSAIAYPTVGITAGQNEMTIAMDINSNTVYLILSDRSIFGQGAGWGIGWFSGGWKGTSSSGDTVASQLDAWAHVVGSYDGTTFKISKDGALENSNAHTITGNAGSTLRLGYYNNTYKEQFNGILEEIRISNIARSAAWNKADYNSCWDMLFTYGSEELRP